jgi:hypothetical protein
MLSPIGIFFRKSRDTHDLEYLGKVPTGSVFQCYRAGDGHAYLLEVGKKNTLSLTDEELSAYFDPIDPSRLLVTEYYINGDGDQRQSLPHLPFGINKLFVAGFPSCRA